MMIYTKTVANKGIGALIMALFLCFTVSPTFVAGEKAENVSPKQIVNTISRLLSHKHLRGAGMSIEIREVKSGKVLFSTGARKTLIPASNVKIVTAAAALSKLGPGYKFRTEVWVDGPIWGGVVRGNLYLKGYGDPLLVDEYLWTLARDIAYRGIFEVRGKIIADNTYFDDKLYGEGWGKIGPEAYYAPANALSLNFNTFVVTANPGGKVGSPPKIFYMAPDKHLKLVNRARTVRGRGKSLLKVIGVEKGVNSYEVVGTIPIKSEAVEIRRKVDDPALYTVGSLEAYLVSWGVVTSGLIEKGKVPADAKLLLTRESKPLSGMVQAIGKMSNNFVAEQIIKTLCAEHGTKEKGSPATTVCGLKVVEDFLSKLDIEPGSYTMADGSGLSRKNRFSAQQLNKVLSAMYRYERAWPEFVAGLSIAGVDGTLDDRFLKSPLKGLMRGKTGHLNGVNTLSGYVPSKRGEILAFSMLLNNFPGYHSTVERIQERILEAVARY